MDHPLTDTCPANGFSPVFLLINPQATTILAVVILFLLIISFIVSGSQVALFSLTFKDINNLKTKQDSSWRRIVSLLEEPKALMASLVIANVIINISVIILSNFLLDQILVQQSFWLFEFLVKVILVTFVIVLFGEVMPKVWANQNNLQFAYYTSGIVELIYLLFRRISFWAVRRSDRLERFFGRRKSSFNLEKLDYEIDRSTDSQASEKEKNILKGIVKFGSITVKQIMRTRLEVSGIDYQLSFGELKNKVEELHYSRLPVYKRSLDDLAGMIHTKDLIPYLNEADDFDWHSLLRPPFFVHEQKMIEDLLQEFQRKRTHFAVVVDEFGGTSGIVTFEDVLEEIIGDIRDEFDEEESAGRQLEDGSYIFEGRTMINDVTKAMNLPPDTFEKVRGDSDSLAGLILELSRKIPAVNEVIPCGEFEFVIVDADSSRIKKVKVSVLKHI
ncbi:MAG: gliding motility-associated protein GldE [Bacteroidota bacterium]|nr:gliding motility-associated protein GldE [Bacteroidota bacterium]MDP4217286.1 gliding motility-associated protein GldE [Bacteroidota bacterium]MDP4248078.1 gliding motility-associated protein GldE [Bacteroidota bacterium]MDP4253953.1 gliding motility-associated protein GldE [Bacteroidota bacterium]MDP4258364.1 gliding motility-associated protein GldE [Bacteroidota bacterium]